MERRVGRACCAAWAIVCALVGGGCGVEARQSDAATSSVGARGREAGVVSALPDAGSVRELAEANAPDTAPPLPPMLRNAERLEDGELRVDLYPPLDVAMERAPLVVLLHGACGDPRDGAWIQGAGRGKSFLACPAGNARCGDGYDWVGPTEARTSAVIAALSAVDKALGGRVDHAGGDILIGYSRGAYLARDLLTRRPGAFRGVVYIGAEIKPDAAGLRAAGIRRVVLASGNFDGAAKQMRATAATLAAQGLPARFVSFGPMGHGWPAEIDAILGEAIAWIREDPTFGS